MKGKNLTNEKIISRFESQFDLVNYAIKLAENMVKSGRAPRIKSDKQSKAFIVLEEIIQGKDSCCDVVAEVFNDEEA